MSKMRVQDEKSWQLIGSNHHEHQKTSSLVALMKDIHRIERLAILIRRTAIGEVIRSDI